MNKGKILGFLFGDHSDLIELDSECVSFLDRNKLFFILSYYITEKSKAPLQNLSAFSAYEKIHKRDLFLRRIQLAKYNEMLQICDHLKKLSIEYAIVKGPILAHMIYGDPCRRSYNDIDILIMDYEKNVSEILLYLKERGYQRDLGWNIRRDIDDKGNDYLERSDHHEVKCICGIGKIYRIEIKNALSAIPRTLISKFYNYFQIYTFNGQELRSFDLMHTFLILCSNVFVNSESRSSVFYRKKFLRHYVDLYNFLKKYRENININDLANFSLQYGLALRIKRVLANLESIISYDSATLKCNTSLVRWINEAKKILSSKQDDINAFTDDVFLEKNPTTFEIVDWGVNVVDRIFNDCRETCISNYKKHVASTTFQNINSNKEKEFFLNKRGHRIVLEFPQGIRTAYKIEFVAGIQHPNVMFWGCIIDNTSIAIQKCRVFVSVGKHWEEFTDEHLYIRGAVTGFELDITKMVQKCEMDGKVIIRISTAKKIDCSIYQELNSAAYEYCLEEEICV